ncbi:MAG TPA: hypothetical protein EYP59_15815 [Thiotrichaceae bacterium]|nr:hypothetical protein [Thiotrichaceae bacterium]
MRYVTTWERRWLKEGIQQGRQQGLQQGVQQGLQLGILQKSRDNITDILEIRFEHVPKMLVQKLQSIDNTLLLPKLLRQAVLVGSLKEFEQLIEKSV